MPKPRAWSSRAGSCSVCAHRSADRINRLLMLATPTTEVAGLVGISTTTLRKHRDVCLAAMLKARKQRQERSARQKAAELYDRSCELIDTSEQAEAYAAAASAVKGATGVLELHARLTGELLDQHQHLHAMVSATPKAVGPGLALEALSREERAQLAELGRKALLGAGPVLEAEAVEAGP